MITRAEAIGHGSIYFIELIKAGRYNSGSIEDALDEFSKIIAHYETLDKSTQPPQRR
jgi:hypothetical protein